MKIRPLFYLSFVLILLACSSKPEVDNKFSNAVFRQVHDAADSRDAKKLLELCKHPEPRVRAEAALCAASVQSEDLVDILKKMLTDADIIIRRNAAFALGQTANEDVIPYLVNAARLQYDEETRKELMIAIAKLLRNPDNFIQEDTVVVGAFEAIQEVNIVFDFFQNTDLSSEILQEGYGISLQYMHRKNIFSPDLATRLKYALQKSGPNGRLAMVGAVATYKGEWLNGNKGYFLQWAKQERNVDIKYHLVKILGNFNDNECLDLVRGFAAARNADIRINISALEVLAKKPELHASALKTCLSHSNEHVVAMALEILTNSSVKIDVQELRNLTQNKSDYVISKAIALELSRKTEGAKQKWEENFTNASSSYNKALFAKSAENCSDCLNILQNAFESSNDPIALYGITEAIIANYTKVNKSAQTEYKQFLEKALSKNDEGVTDLVAYALESTEWNTAEKSSFASRLKDIREGLKLPRQTEVYNHLTVIINSFAETSFDKAKIDFTQKIDWEFISTLSNEDILEFETEKGIIRMQLYLDEAPGSVAFIAKLVEEGYYDGKSFHRIIPNFVAQGGCPIGTGMGSSEYPIRSEFTMHRFNRGTVGLASAGKDTESCQFFINYRETPHLDGRYTAFAQVLEGIETIDDLVFGDKITKATLIRKSN